MAKGLEGRGAVSHEAPTVLLRAQACARPNHLPVELSTWRRTTLVRIGVGRPGGGRTCGVHLLVNDSYPCSASAQLPTPGQASLRSWAISETQPADRGEGGQESSRLTSNRALELRRSTPTAPLTLVLPRVSSAALLCALLCKCASLSRPGESSWSIREHVDAALVETVTPTPHERWQVRGVTEERAEFMPHGVLVSEGSGAGCTAVPGSGRVGA